MTINLLPQDLQAIVQSDTLQRKWEDTPYAKLGFRTAADKETFSAGWGETITKTRPGLRATPQTPLSAANSASFSSGMTPSTFGVEQYTLALEMWGDQAESNLVTEGVAIKSKFKKDFETLHEQANRKVDELARDELFDGYMGGNTRLRNNASSSTIQVDDIRGISPGMVLKVGTDLRTVHASGATANVALGASTVFRGVPGDVVLTASVTASANVAVVAETAPLILRANATATTSAGLTANDKITSSMIIKAVARHRANGVEPIDGFYNLFIDPEQASALLEDQKFLQAFQGAGNSAEFVNGAVSHLYGVRLIVQNMSPIDGSGVRRAIVVGKGALVESVFTESGYNNVAQAGAGISHVTLGNGIAHIIRPALDAAGMWVTQSWIYIGGFVVPTDKGTTSQVIPTATNAALKRAIILESY